MPTHSTALDNVRVEVAFSADPNTATPAFVDLTSRAMLSAGIDITRGRNEAAGEVQTGSCNLTLDNTDGALSPELASSPYYPNVKPQNRLRVTYRDPSVAGNLLSAEDASFEGGTVGGWTGTSGAAVVNSNTRADDGTRSLRVTWPTVAANGASARVVGASGLVIGRVYTVRARVWVTATTPAVRIAFVQNTFPFYGSQSTTTGAWETISSTFTAVSNELVLVVRPNAAATAGQQVWIDSVRVDEGTSTAYAVTAVPIVYRFDGYVDEWPIEWPNGGDNDSRSTVRAFDLQSRLSRTRTLQSVIAETMRLDDPLWHLPLDEPDGSTSAGDRVGGGASVAVTVSGVGGELAFSAGTGPGTDGSGAPMFTPTDANSGLFLYGELPVTPFLTTAATLRATFQSSNVATAQTVASWANVWGQCIAVGTSAAGNAVARMTNPWRPADDQSVTSASIYADGRTHDIAVRLQNTAGTYSLSLVVDGVQQGSAVTWAAPSSYIFGLDRVYIGGRGLGEMFTGTISHVAGFDAALADATLADHYESTTGGFAGDRSDERIARIASWLDVPAELLDLDVGASTVGHSDPTGKTGWRAMQEVADTEAGALFIGTMGAVTFHARSRTYDTTAAVDVSVDAEVVGPDVRLSSGIAGVANDITVTRLGGATARAVDATSASTYGTLGDSLDVISGTDTDAVDRAEWELALRSTPRVRLPELELDGLTEPGTAADVRALDIGSRVEVTGLPAQAPASAAGLRVQGYTERIGAGGWSITANTTPYLPVLPLILDDAVYGLLDEDNRLAY